MAQSYANGGRDAAAIAAFAATVGLELSQADREALASEVQRVVEKLRAADAEFQEDEPFPAYLT